MIRQSLRALLCVSVAIGVTGCASEAPIQCPDGTSYRKATVLGRKSDICINADQKIHGPVISWHAKGKKQSEGRYENGLAHGEFKQWSEDGELLGSYTMTKGTGTYKWWHEPDKQAEETAYKEGKKHGKSTRWHKNGKEAQQGEFAEDRKQGEWSYWDDKGELEKVEVYEKGKLKETREEQAAEAE